jgi:hypothetical protein
LYFRGILLFKGVDLPGQRKHINSGKYIVGVMGYYKVKPDKNGKVRSSPWKVHFAIKKGKGDVTIGYFLTEEDAQRVNEIAEKIIHDNPDESKEVITDRIRQLLHASHRPDKLHAKNDRDIEKYTEEVHKNIKESIGDTKYFCALGPQEKWCNKCQAPFDVARRIEVKCCPAGCTDIIDRSKRKTGPGELIWL